jgi:HD-GYP domain-containing protein (c-di-GMP phosphodiesterase class II)
MYKELVLRLRAERIRARSYPLKRAVVLYAKDKNEIRHNEKQIRSRIAQFEAMHAALGRKDSGYTLGHSYRVAIMCYRFALLLGMKGSERVDIVVSAYCHDVGKIGVPQELLWKSAQLDREEYSQMKSHTVYGANLIDNMIGSKYVSNAVLYHHERWNGRGYPAGLCANAIPFAARVIAVFDSIDAMVGNRKYRKNLELADAREQIRNNSGVMYDPEIVSVCMQNWDFLVGGIYETRGKSINIF